MRIKLCGVCVEITFLFVALLAFIIVVDSSGNLIITIFSSCAHEMGHLIAMMLMNNKPKKVTFELGGINIEKQDKILLSLNKEIVITLFGPIINAVILIICCTLYCVLHLDTLLVLSGVNLVLMTFNMLPIKGLDGGRALYYFLCKKHSQIFSKNIILIFSILMLSIVFVWGIYVFLVSGYNFSLILIGVFLLLSLFNGKEC